MSYHPVSHYLCHAVRGQHSVSLMGPLRCEEVVALVRLNENTQDAYFFNATRYELSKRGAYPRTKKGEAQLIEDMCINFPRFTIRGLDTPLVVSRFGFPKRTITIPHPYPVQP